MAKAELINNEILTPEQLIAGMQVLAEDETHPGFVHNPVDNSHAVFSYRFTGITPEDEAVNMAGLLVATCRTNEQGQDQVDFTRLITAPRGLVTLSGMPDNSINVIQTPNQGVLKWHVGYYFPYKHYGLPQELADINEMGIKGLFLGDEELGTHAIGWNSSTGSIDMESTYKDHIGPDSETTGIIPAHQQMLQKYLAQNGYIN